MTTKPMDIRTCLALDASTAKKLDRLAKGAGISRSSAMRELIAAQSGSLDIPDRRRRLYSPWNDLIGRPREARNG